MSTIPAQLISQVKRHEGFSSTPYTCTAGAATIGYGTNLEALPQYIPFGDLRTQVEAGLLKGKSLVGLLKQREFSWSRDDAEKSLVTELLQCAAQLEKKCPAYIELVKQGDSVRAAVLINMCFNMGIGFPSNPARQAAGRGLLSFTNTLKLIETGQYALVAENMLSSRWAIQVKGRAQELARQMRTGEWQ